MQPEALFRQRVHRNLKKKDSEFKIHIQSMEAGAGTPDYYYEAQGVHLWVEYKVAPNKCSTRQRLWITRARGNGQPVWVATFLKNTDEVSVQFSYNVVETMPFKAYIDKLFNYLTRGE